MSQPDATKAKPDFRDLSIDPQRAEQCRQEFETRQREKRAREPWPKRRPKQRRR